MTKHAHACNSSTHGMCFVSGISALKRAAMTFDGYRPSLEVPRRPLLPIPYSKNTGVLAVRQVTSQLAITSYVFHGETERNLGVATYARRLP